jgi:protein phosphatase
MSQPSSQPSSQPPSQFQPPPCPIYCPNPLCQAVNSGQLAQCQRCQTFIPRRFLWALAPAGEELKPGQLLADRYAVLADDNRPVGQHRIVLDTKPGYLPDFPAEIPAAALPYMALFGLRNHIPQPYGMASMTVGSPGETWREQSETIGPTSAVLLLEQAAIYPAEAHDPAELPIGGTLMPKLLDHWLIGSDQSRLHWLWQIVQIWLACGRQPSRATLVNPSLLRLDGQRLKVLELQTDIDTVTFAELAHFWATRPVQTAGKFWQQLSSAMIQGDIESEEHLLAILDQTLSHLSHDHPVSYDWATQTDQGPGRPYNEDFCYPAPKLSAQMVRQTTQPPIPSAAVLPLDVQSDSTIKSLGSKFVIVCDGIGGHDGGDVASKLAVGTIVERLSAVDEFRSGSVQSVIGYLEDTVLMANDAIADRNDQENRQGRQRMGTTLVMALVLDNQLYLTHIGDSRAYRITRNRCTQMTLDDDVASRDTRLGNAFYRDSCQYPGAGSLTQALGMVQSEWLNPTTQRFVLDEDCLFLLCSDGLSDFDRIEECWAEEIRPALLGERELQTTVERLIEIANTRNGHDNVTVGLIHLKVPLRTQAVNQGTLDFPLELGKFKSSTTTAMTPAGIRSAAVATQAATQVAVLPSRRQVPMVSDRPLVNGRPPRRQSSPLLLLLGLGVIGLGLWWLRATWFPTESPISNVSLGPAPSPVVEPTLAADRLIKFVDPGLAPLTLLPQPGKLTPVSVGMVPSGAILKVMGRQTLPDQQTWVKLQVCTTPALQSPIDQPTVDKPSPNPPPPLPLGTLPPGASGWVEEAAIAPFASPNLRLTPEQQKACSPVATGLPIGNPSVAPKVMPSAMPSVKPIVMPSLSPEQQQVRPSPPPMGSP